MTMGLRKELERRMERKIEEVMEYELKAREGRAYLQALEDTLKWMPPETPTDPSEVLRPGSALAKSRGALLKAGHSLHVSALLKACGKEDSKKNRAALGGSIANYVRRGQIFTRPRPNTFGLVELPDDEMEHDEAESPAPRREEEPPPSFGKDDGPSIPPQPTVSEDEDIPF